MGIVAKACWGLTLSLGWSVRAEIGLFARGTGDRGSCVNLRGRNGRHCRLERLIERAVPVLASLSAGLRASTITVWSRQYAMLGLSI